MDISRADGVGGPGRIEGPQKVSRVQPPAGPDRAAPSDKVEISDSARLVSEALSLPAVREDRVEEMRRLVESGRLETPERLEGALDKFLRENPDLLE
jgi:anti-sigma28 factor (negative regulator of flagellin synthesis)